MLSSPYDLKDKSEAVFISDLHLHPEQVNISERFYQCIEWVGKHSKTLYILGDFFHVWPGDDGFSPWSLQIAAALKGLSKAGVTVYFMPGNRDFLVGKRFYKESGAIKMVEPHLIQLGDTKVLLVHGDRFCTKDWSHQCFRRLTRNPIFAALFLSLPFSLRNKLVASVREFSEQGAYKPNIMGTVPSVVIKGMERSGVNTVIHGHTHVPGLTEHQYKGQNFRQYILSDWDDKPELLCYDKSKGFYFVHYS